MKKFSWRKTKTNGWTDPTLYTLFYDGDEVAYVQEHKKGCDLWFWYGGGKNTRNSAQDLKSAKKDAKAHIQSLILEANNTK